MFLEIFAPFRLIVCVRAEMSPEFALMSLMFLEIFPTFLLIRCVAAEISPELALMLDMRAKIPAVLSPIF